jgi:hypothetical protein
MAYTRLTRPSPLALLISETAYRAVQATGEFFQRFTRTPRRSTAPLTRGEMIADFMRSQHCRCSGGTCRRCQHLIDDVIGN